MMYGHGFYGYGGFGMWHFFIMAGTTLLVIAFVLWLVKKYKSTNVGNMTIEDKAIEILKIKFANGEITEEEYNQRLSVLTRE